MCICRKIFPVHPKFRMIGVGETLKSSGSNQTGGSGSGPTPSLAPWISPELLSMFQFHHVKALPVDQERHIIQHKVHTVGAHVHTYIHIHTRTQVHTHICIYICTHACGCTHTYVHTHIYIHACGCTHIHTYTHIHMHTRTRVHTHTYTYTHAEIHRHNMEGQG